MGLKRTRRYLLLAVGYGAIINLAYLVSLLLRFEGEVPARFWAGYRAALPAFTLLSLAGYYSVGLFHSLWRYAGTVTLFQILKAATLSAMSMVVITLFSTEALFPRSLIVMVWLWQVALVSGARFTWRLGRERVLGPGPRRAVRTLVVGADSRGVHLAQEMRRAVTATEPLVPVGFVDDDPRLSGRLVEGLKVFGTVADLPRVLTELSAEMVIVSDPGVPARVVREIARFCAEAKVRVKTLPGLADLHQGRSRLAQVRDMRIEDLLGREPVQLDLGEVAEFVRGERVLVTGAGGSIGSELARQVAEHGPSELILLDHSENGLYYVHNELLAQRPGLPVHPVISDIRDLEGMEVVFRRYRPTLVLHAAAHKHVPLLEANPREAVLNNITGTRHMVQLSDRHGVRKFVLISTDKAVNPTSVMGVSKRVCEMLLQSRSQTSATRFVAVRFGNVLGSDGSVIPLFQRQLERGGPITVTHPEARRYFMTIPEAVRLVLQAGAMGRGGDVYLLEMGEQVRILDLARQVIHLAGLREGEDIEIVFTGLRPGEKLYEELHYDSEKTRMTRHERIIKWELDVCDEERLLREVTALERLAQTGDLAAIRRGLARLVPEFSEAPVMPIEAEPATPVVELPVATPIPTPRPRRDWSGLWRRAGVSIVAALALVISAPLWALLWLEARRLGQRTFLAHEMRVGRTRRRQPRQPLAAGVATDRRSQDLFGRPIRCARFRSDLGSVSRWAARHRLDKLPFLLNVLRGEMTLVGPHPEKEELVLRSHHLVPGYARRFTVLPGVTGLAEISECEDSEADGVVRRVHYDLFYIDHRSLLLDVRTLGRTLGVLARRPRASLAPPAGAPAREPAVKGVTR